IVILGDDGAFAVGHSVLAKVAGAEVGRHNLQRAAGGIRGRRLAFAPATAVTGPLPFRSGIALPLGGAALRSRSAEVQKTGLSAGMRSKVQSSVIVPSDMEASRNTHDGRGAVRFTLIASGFIFGRVPGVGDFCAFGI